MKAKIFLRLIKIRFHHLSSMPAVKMFLSTLHTLLIGLTNSDYSKCFHRQKVTLRRNRVTGPRGSSALRDWSERNADPLEQVRIPAQGECAVHSYFTLNEQYNFLPKLTTDLQSQIEYRNSLKRQMPSVLKN